MKRRTEDLHGFDVLSALDFAVSRVHEAYANGYDEIEFLHGSADVHERVDEGRGRIKWGLRDLLERGSLDTWARPGDSWPKAASLIVALRRNPRPRPESWGPAPRRTHRR